jgi:hypothetical protein
VFTVALASLLLDPGPALGPSAADHEQLHRGSGWYSADTAVPEPPLALALVIIAAAGMRARARRRRAPY